MKRSLSILLTFAMLVAMLAAFATVPAQAAGSSDPLSVSFVSAQAYKGGVAEESNTSTLGTYFKGQWKDLFNPNHTSSSTRLTAFLEADETVEVIGKLAEPSEITKIVFRVGAKNKSRLCGLVVMFSENGTDWTKGITMQADKDASANWADFPVSLVSDGTKYSYVKLFKSGAHVDESLSGVKGSYVDLLHIRFYDEGDSAKTMIEASYEETLTSATSENLDKFFTVGNRDVAFVSGNIKPDNLVVGKLSHPTVITDLYLSYFGASVNWTKVYGSVDGSSWVEIAQLTGLYGNANNTATDAIAHLEVTNTTAFNYVKIERNHNYGSGWKSYYIGFAGTEMPAPNNNLYYQTKVEDGKWAVRFITTVDDLSYEKVGYEIVATSAALDADRVWDRSTATVYSSVMESCIKEGVPVKECRDAAYFGGNYIFTAVVSQIPVDTYGDITFTVTPYTLVNGAKQYAAATVITFNNGVCVTE